MEKTIKKYHIFWVDNLRAISALAVVLLHVCLQVVVFFGKIPNSDWWVGNIYQSFTRFCVPVFIMLTGVLLLGREVTLLNFFKTRLSRILIPFVFWSFIYIIYQLFKQEKNLTLIEQLVFIFDKLRYGAYYHMWYIYMIIGIYLIFPIFNGWIKHSTEKEQIYFLLVCLLVILMGYFPFTLLKTNIDFSYFSCYPGFFVLGYFLYKKKISNSLKTSVLLIAVFFCSSIIIALNTYCLSMKNNKLIEGFVPWDTFQTISIFILFKINKIFNKKIKILSFISKYSYGIYLIHVLVLELLLMLPLSEMFSPIVYLPIFFILTVTVSLFILYIMGRLPLLDRVVK